MIHAGMQKLHIEKQLVKAAASHTPVDLRIAHAEPSIHPIQSQNPMRPPQLYVKQ